VRAGLQDIEKDRESHDTGDESFRMAETVDAIERDAVN